LARALCWTVQNVLLAVKTELEQELERESALPEVNMWQETGDCLQIDKDCQDSVPPQATQKLLVKNTYYSMGS
jgi:hypothetical protein